MNLIVINRVEMLIGVDTISNHPEMPVNAVAAALFVDNRTVITNMATAGASQCQPKRLIA